MKYILDLQDKKSLERIKDLFNNYYNIMNILNKDSEESVNGGAEMNYEIEIKIKEVWY